MEYANGGDSFEYVRKKGGLQENEARWFFQQLIVALDYCHRKGVVNRDVKLENTLIHWAQKPLLKICDFGYSKDEKYQSAPASRVGTPAYLAPEVILNKKGETYNGKQADVWSCGVMLFVTLVGQYPFERPDDKGDPQKLHKMIRRIVHVDYQFPSRVSVSEGCQVCRPLAFLNTVGFGLGLLNFVRTNSNTQPLFQETPSNCKTLV